MLRALAAVLSELISGPSSDAAFVLNREDLGLLRSLDKLSASAASAIPPGGTSSIAAHVDHVRYGLELLNRWGRDENPFDDADYSASWRRVTVSAEEWSRLRADLRREALAWREHVARDFSPANGGLNDVEITGVIASVAHLAYHLGAIRQIDATTRGPRATD